MAANILIIFHTSVWTFRPDDAGILPRYRNLTLGGLDISTSTEHGGSTVTSGMHSPVHQRQLVADHSISLFRISVQIHRAGGTGLCPKAGAGFPASYPLPPLRLVSVNGLHRRHNIDSLTMS
jgi:hypothetical protein